MASLGARPWGKGAVAWAVAGMALLGQPAAAQDGTPFSAPWNSQPDNAAVADADEPLAEADLAVALPSARQHPFGFSTPLAASAIMPGADRARAIDCMTAAIAYEAGYEPLAGQEAVAQVILNRVRHPRFPKTVCGVVFDGSYRRTGCQFTFTCDGSLARRLRPAIMDRARAVAVSAIDGLTPDRVAGATHYHANYVNPYWASSGMMTARIGAHLFYRMPGDGGPGAMSPVRTQGESGLALLDLPTPVTYRAPANQRVPMPRSVAAGQLFSPWGLPVMAQPPARP
ncbi:MULTISPECIES: cell wall hydrolase [unclassified Sphingomonas]|uniref:cell wall hydrolase n=1 Tax=Novosphingobium rhizosphaerae TaxID=1551649 RepID=UPI0015C96711